MSMLPEIVVESKQTALTGPTATFPKARATQFSFPLRPPNDRRSQQLPPRKRSVPGECSLVAESPGNAACPSPLQGLQEQLSGSCWEGAFEPRHDYEASPWCRSLPDCTQGVSSQTWFHRVHLMPASENKRTMSCISSQPRSHTSVREQLHSGPRLPHHTLQTH